MKEFVVNCLSHRSETIDFALEKVVTEVRSELAKQYDVTGGIYVNYQGLCDKAHELFVEKMIVRYPMVIVNSHHGEQRHGPRLEAKYWQNQHTWSSVETLSRTIIYVDITSQQFQRFYGDIPDYYISVTEPEWFYPDDRNPYFRWKKRSKFIGKIIYVCQYYFWWNLSDFIRLWRLG